MKESKRSKQIGKIIDSIRAFRKGDKVYSMRNSAWGLWPMKVIDVHSNGCSFKHTNLGTGWFGFRDLELESLITPERLAQIDLLKRAESEVSDMKAKLFGKGA